MSENTLHEYIENIKATYPLQSIVEILKKFKNTKTLVIGDAIIDEYHFTMPKGRATKDPILSVDYINHEVYPGGILAIANHVANFADQVSLVTMLGDTNDNKEFIKSQLKSNIKPTFFVKQSSPTTLKKRYLNIVRNEKLFKLEHINDKPLSEELERQIIKFLEEELPKYDLVIVGDFGHSLISNKIIETLEKYSKYLAINVQCNSANLGFNYVTKYGKPSFISMDLQEIQYAVADKYSPMPELMKKLHQMQGYQKFIATMGKDGTYFFNHNTISHAPAFITRPADTVGAGDAVFSITALFSYIGADELIPFVANCAGGIAVSYLGNKQSVNQDNLLEFIKEAYEGNIKMR